MNILEKVCDELREVKKEVSVLEEQYYQNMLLLKYTRNFLRKNIEGIENRSAKFDSEKLLNFMQDNMEILVNGWKNFGQEYQRLQNDLGVKLQMKEEREVDEDEERLAITDFVNGFMRAVKKYVVILMNFQKKNKIINDSLRSDFKIEDIKKLKEKIVMM
ncbi:MAG TPA: hypothetical protein PLH65_02155 [bacterium]|nr:hypothetical protein [bacterium]